MRKNCTECQFGEMKFNDLTPLDDSYLPYKGAAYVKCGQGKGDTILAFYGRNGDKPTREVTEELSCFVPSEGANRLNNLENALQEMIDGLRELRK